MENSDAKLQAPQYGPMRQTMTGIAEQPKDDARAKVVAICGEK